MPGQTEFALCLHGMLDGRKVAFTGDNLFGDPADPRQNGHEAMVAHNSAVLEEGYILGAEFLHRLKPDLLIGGHSFVMDRPARFIERYRQWAYAMRDAFRALSSDPDYRYWFDPFWIRAEPYRVSIPPGGQAETVLFLRNFASYAQAYRVALHCPAGLALEPAVIEQRIPGRSILRMPLRIKAAAELKAGVSVIGLETTVAGKRYGERFDFIVWTGPGETPRP
jgi:hypothetical protein